MTNAVVTGMDHAMYANIPVDALRYMASEHKITTSSRKKDELLDSLLEQKPEAVEQLYREFRFAGRTAIDWYCVEPKSSMPSTKGDIWSVIVEKYSTDIMHLGRRRPQLQADPQLVFAEPCEISGTGVIVLMFAYNGTDRRVLVDYEPQIISPTYFDYVIVRPGNPVMFETRGSLTMSKKLVAAASAIFEIEESDIQHLELSGEEFCNNLVQLLSAQLQTARHKSPVGDYDYIEVTVDPMMGDLSKSERYNEELAASPSRRKILTFEYVYDFGLKETVTLEINTTNGNLWFRSTVGEQVIDYVLLKTIEIMRNGGTGEDVSTDGTSQLVSGASRT